MAEGAACLGPVLDIDTPRSINVPASKPIFSRLSGHVDRAVRDRASKPHMKTRKKPAKIS